MGLVASRTHQRGAVLLLSVYFAALTMLLLSGIALQRTTTELRAAQLSRDREQAFFLAEAGVDLALKQLSLDPLSIPKDITQSVSLPTGTVDYHSTVLETTRTNATIARVLEIRTTGRPTGTGRTADVVAVVRTEQTLNGVIAAGKITSYPWLNWPNMPVVNGNMRTALGEVESIWIDPGMVVNGTATIGPSTYPTNPQGWQRLAGSNPSTDGIVLATASEHWALGGRPPGSATATASAPMDQLSEPTFPSSCSTTPLIVTSGTVTLTDGGPWDQGPAGDGKVVLCVPYVVVDDYAALVIQHPTTLYAQDYVTNYGTITVDSSLLSRPDRGMVAVIGQPGYPQVNQSMVGRYTGSIYAPSELVVFSLMAMECRDHSLIIPRELGFAVVATANLVDNVTLNFPSPASLPKPVVSILSWTS